MYKKLVSQAFIEALTVEMHEFVQRRLCHGWTLKRDLHEIISDVINQKMNDITALQHFDHTVTEIANYLIDFIAFKALPGWIELVNNDPKGWERIIELKKEYREKGKYLRLRGRGKNRVERMRAFGFDANAHTAQRDLPIKCADKIAVYVR